MFHPNAYLDLRHTDHQILINRNSRVWEILSNISSYLADYLTPANYGIKNGNSYIGKNVFIGKNTIIEEGAVILGPAWIGEGCQLRKGCYIRENVIVGNNSVIGNSCELKNSLLFDEVQVPHFNYVGDSILGYRAHLGAGVILSNVRLDRQEIIIKIENLKISTGLKKFGAILGDYVEIGCNAVLSPGSIIGRESLIYPMVSWHGILPEKSIVKKQEEYQILAR
ncbi:MAG: UDP-N-acetylglucosamine diphosphorylase [Verrucomicrobia bacterium]|jgi:NDP-sugar pyrophosphorylase family protein|nr:MAG: UDP-N-acetylglucosamine diphosphorylase [Verrucomicrobiota bacterium]MDH4469979.1 UDP-N-acetylglucosamine diphosphorylase [Verrucomicrobiae bacterium]